MTPGLTHSMVFVQQGLNSEKPVMVQRSVLSPFGPFLRAFEPSPNHPRKWFPKMGNVSCGVVSMPHT